MTGRLRFFHANWLNITRDQFILNAVQGFKICFRCTPVQSVVPRVSDQSSIIKNEIVSLLKKGAIRQVPFSHDGFYHRLFLVPKKGGGQRPVLDLSALNQFIETEHFKMENLVTLKSLLNKGDYMINLDLTDAYLTVPMHPDSRKFLRFLLGDKTYEFTAMPFGLNVAPRLFTKIMKPVVASLRSQGVRLIIYLDDILIIASSIETLNRHKTLALSLLESLGFLINYEKSNLTPSQQIVFLGMLVDSASMQFILPPTESCTDSKGMSPPPKHKQANYSPFVSGPRASRGMSSSRMVCPTSLPSTTNSSDKRPSEMGELQRPGGFDTSGQIRPIMVGNDPTNPARESNCSTNSRLNHLLGCFQTGVGGILGFPTDRRSLERERVSRPHKCIRTPGSILCPKVLSPDPNQQSHLPETRQYHSSLVPKQLGGHSLPATSPSSNSDLGLVREREETPISSGTAYPRQNQCGSGYRVPGETGSERLEDTTENHSTPYKRLHDRSLCLPPHTPTKTVCQLETGSERGAQRRLHDGLVESEGICLPSVQLNSVSSSEGQEGTRDSGASGTTMDHTTLVASTDRTYCGLPGISGEQPQTTARRVQSRSDAPSFSISEVSRLENIRQRYKTMGISEKAIELLCNNTKSSTSKTYNVSWAQWSRWCSERKSDPVSCPVSDILTFLAEQFSQGKEYRSINVLRSAISSAHCHIDDKPVGQHPLIVRLMRGVSISRPPQPRYQKTLNVSVVTTHLASLGCNKTMSIKQLSQKLCMLMALTCPERSSVMASLDITYMRHYPEGVKFSHTIFRKRAHSGNLGESVYPKFTDESLCPVTCLSVYLERTKDWRATNKDKPRLFLSIKKPHKPVSSSTLSRWIKETIFQSGIKDFSFKGHSVRSASTSAARASGLSIDTIISMADWTNESTFKKFYYRPSLPVTYGTTVLSNSS